MSKILRSILADQLYIIPSDWQNYKSLPSPNDLKFKVIIKGKGTLGLLDQRNE